MSSPEVARLIVIVDAINNYVELGYGFKEMAEKLGMSEADVRRIYWEYCW